MSGLKQNPENIFGTRSTEPYTYGKRIVGDGNYFEEKILGSNVSK